MSTVAASSTPLFVRLNTTCTTDPATGVEGCYSAVVRDRRGSPRPPRVTERHPVILDVDTGIDDSLALLYACASPEVELVAATCVAGNVDARQVAVNTRAVLELADRADVEVALGRETPLVRPLTTTPETHGPRGIGYAEVPPPARPTEWNISVDPDAAAVVFTHCGAPEVQAARKSAGLEPRPLALGLDVTEKAKLTPEHLTALAARAGDDAHAPRTPIVRYLADALRFYMEFHSRYDGFFGAFIHDPLALAAALDPSLVRAEALAVAGGLGGILTTGETVNAQS